MNLGEPSPTNLSRLTEISKQLSERSKDLNQLLLDLEEKLVAMRLGVEVWLTDKPLSSEYRMGGQGETDQEGIEHVPGFRDEEVFGFARLEKSYALQVKKVTYQLGTEDGEDTEEVVWEGIPRHIQVVSRRLRVRALQQIQHLIVALEEEAEGVLEAMAEGRKLVNKL